MTSPGGDVLFALVGLAGHMLQIQLALEQAEELLI